MDGRIKSGHDGVGVAVEEYGSRVRPAPKAKPDGSGTCPATTTCGRGAAGETARRPPPYISVRTAQSSGNRRMAVARVR